MDCYFCHGPALAGDEPVNPDHGIGPRCCAHCITTSRAVCCVICECLVPSRDATERPDLGASPMGGCWLCLDCEEIEQEGAAEDPDDGTAEAHARA